MGKSITRTAKRAEFLALLLAGAIEHSGYGFAGVVEWHCPGEAYGEWHAVIFDRYAEADNMGDEPSQTWRVDLDTMAHGLGIIRRAIVATTEDGQDDVLHNADTFERLYLNQAVRRDLLLGDRTNGDDGDYDVIGALAVLECALFGAVVYN